MRRAHPESFAEWLRAHPYGASSGSLLLPADMPTLPEIEPWTADEGPGLLIAELLKPPKHKKRRA